MSSHLLEDNQNRSFRLSTPLMSDRSHLSSSRRPSASASGDEKERFDPSGLGRLTWSMQVTQEVGKHWIVEMVCC